MSLWINLKMSIHRVEGIKTDNEMDNSLPNTKSIKVENRIIQTQIKLERREIYVLRKLPYATAANGRVECMTVSRRNDRIRRASFFE